MFSAFRFVVAATIVALFGGFLLAGVLTTQPGDEMAPAAVTTSPSPMTTSQLLSGLTTEGVEPGVLRVISDGYRELSHPDDGFPSFFVDIAPDGGVWLSGYGYPGLFRLGEEPTFGNPTEWPPSIAIAPDGTLWTIGENVIHSFDGQTWKKWMNGNRERLQLGALAVGPNGAVWVAASGRDKRCLESAADCPYTVLVRLDLDGSMTAIDDWGDLFDGAVASDELAVSPDGDVWLIGMVDRDSSVEAEALLRFDGSEWDLIPGPVGFVNAFTGHSLDFGPDGTLWVHTVHPKEDGWGVGGLARFDDPGWTTFDAADGVQDWGGQGWVAMDLLHVAPDGSLWLNGASDDGGCGGVAHYDGTTWTSYLRYLCVHDLDIAPDGSALVRANGYGGMHPVDEVGTYVITPEGAVAPE